MNGGNQQVDQRTLAETQKLIREGAPQKALAHLGPMLAKSKRVGPEHALHLQALIAMGHRAEAMQALRKAADLPITTGDAADALAFFARQLEQHRMANELYKLTTEIDPRSARFWFNFATSEMNHGNLANAAEAAQKAIRIDPRFHAATLLRSEAGRATEDSNHIAELRDKIAEGGPVENLVPLYFALGKELHELGRYDEAFAAFATGAEERRRRLNYDVAQDVQKLARIQEVFATGDTELHERKEPARHIFIIGLPRSGTTLTERILGALPDVRSNNETNNFTVALLQNSAKDGGDVFERAARADFAAVGKEYEALAASDGFKGSIIEKLPFNYLYVGAILQAIPDAAIVSVRRHPLDSCFAMFRTLFAQAYPFSYSFDDLARYYAAFDRLMCHWETIYPGRLINVQYEELVREPEAIAPEIASRCGLPWSSDALQISQNRSVSLTASAAQVRGGIYSTSVGIWQKYGKDLEPLADALRAQGVKFTVD